TLQALIDESLKKGGRQGIQARRNSLKIAVEASTVMLDAEGRASRPNLGELQARLLRSEAALARAEAVETRRAEQYALRFEREQAAKAKRLEAEAQARRAPAAIKRRIIAESIDGYPGPCPCPYSTARNG